MTVAQAAVEFEELVKLAQVTGQQRKQDAVDHLHHRLLLRIELHGHAAILDLYDGVPGDTQGAGKRLQRLPQDAAALEHAEAAIGLQRLLDAGQLLGLVEASAHHGRLGQGGLDLLHGRCGAGGGQEGQQG